MNAFRELATTDHNREKLAAELNRIYERAQLDHFPLPHAYMGDLLRFNRDEVDQWAREEAERRRVQYEKRRLKIA